MATYVETVTTDGATSYWRLGEGGAGGPPAFQNSAFSRTVADDAIGTVDGVYENVTLRQPGALSQDANTSALFNGDLGGTLGSRVSFGDNYGFADGYSSTSFFQPNAFQAAPAPFSFDAWVYPTLLDSTWRRICGKTDTSFSGWYLFATDSGTAFIRQSGTVGGGTFPGPPLPLSEWSHVGISYDKEYVRLYVGGVLRGITRNSVLLAPNTSTSFLLGNDPSFTSTWQGRIDEAAVYPGIVLTDAQFANHFLVGSSQGGDPSQIASKEAFGNPLVIKLSSLKTVSGLGAISSGQAFGTARAVILFPSVSGDPGTDILTAITPLNRLSVRDGRLVTSADARATLAALQPSDASLAAAAKTDAPLRTIRATDHAH